MYLISFTIDYLSQSPSSIEFISAIPAEGPFKDKRINALIVVVHDNTGPYVNILWGVINSLQEGPAFPTVSEQI